jgi:hypothetical protein
VLIGFTLLLSHLVARNSNGRNAWALMTLASLWLPSQMPLLLAIGLAVGASFDEAMAQALVNGIGGIVAAGITTGFGARFRLAPERRVATTATAAA